MFGWLDPLLPSLDPDREASLRGSMPVNSAGFDPFGLDMDTTVRTLRSASFLYRRWFRVRPHHLGRIPDGPAMLVGNHGGQLPLDGMLVAMAVALEGEPPRVVRAMVERWFPSLPFLSTLFSRCGQVVGDPVHTRELLRREQLVLVFPEGIRGSGKPFRDRYQLQGFGTGFARLALEAGVPVVPVGIVGSEETYPALTNLSFLAKILGFPYVPVTPFFPHLGLLGAVPLPVQVDIVVGEPMHLQGQADGSDAEIAGQVERVRGAIQALVDAKKAERPVLTALDRVQGWLP